MNPDLHNWDTIGELVDRLKPGIVYRGDTGAILLCGTTNPPTIDRHRAIGPRPGLTHDDMLREARKMVRDHVRPCV